MRSNIAGKIGKKSRNELKLSDEYALVKIVYTFNNMVINTTISNFYMMSSGVTGLRSMVVFQYKSGAAKEYYVKHSKMTFSSWNRTSSGGTYSFRIFDDKGIDSTASFSPAQAYNDCDFPMLSIPSKSRLYNDSLEYNFRRVKTGNTGFECFHKRLKGTVTIYCKIKKSDILGLYEKESAEYHGKAQIIA